MSDFIYDQVQYTSHPYRQTHPEHLYTIAQLFGVRPTALKNARILELGCASAGNIIPIALNYPKATLVGIDLSSNQIEEGKNMVKALGLKNITLLAMSIFDIEPSLGKFDYIICHGVYSWVPDNVKNKILAVCKDHLSPEGVAYISYNTYPGWNMVQSARDMMLYHTKDLSTHDEKITQARALLHFIGEGLEEEKTAYSDFLNQEMQLLQQQPDHYLLHEHLGELNHPMHFYEFIQLANDHGLNYLSDTYPSTMFAGNLPSKIAQTLSEVTDIVRSSQYIDFIRNQRFRCTLLCLNTVNINRHIETNHIEKFYLSYTGGVSNPPLNEADCLVKDTPMVFSGAGLSLTVRHPISKLAMFWLQEQQGVPLAHDELVKKLYKKLKASEASLTIDAIKNHLANDLNLMRLVFGGLIELSSAPAHYITTTTEKPLVTKLVRLQAKTQDLVTNQRHQVIKLNAFERVFIALLNGHNTQSKILKILTDQALKGEFNLTDAQQKAITDPTQIQDQMSQFCMQTYQKFAQNALLIAQNRKVAMPVC